MIEEWRAIPGWEGFYECNPSGEIRRITRFVNSNVGLFRLHRGRVLKGSRTGKYIDVKLNAEGRSSRVLIHRLICTVFHGEPPTDDSQVRHLNGCSTDNRASNLAWGTALDNAADRVLHGTDPQGERAGNAKLTEADVLQIRAAYRPGYGGLARLARQFGVTSTQILHIVRRRQWTHI